jgi:uncharacterized membrane protein
MTSVTESRCCRGSQERDTPHETSSVALQILTERFARGEIDKVEFEEKRQIIAGIREETASAARSRKDCGC